MENQLVFHNRPIAKKCIRVTVEEVQENIPLLISVPEAEQVNLAHAAGSSVLWLKRFTFHDNRENI